ncbi:MAG: plastocyanin/azurin family copper-binding protein [Anaerolineae bacterium]
MAIVLAGCAPRTAEPTATPVVADQAIATAAPATGVPATTQPATAPATVVAAAATATTSDPSDYSSVPTLATVAPEATTVVPTVSAGVVSGEGEVELEDFQFVPKVLTVRVGTEVKFSNKDSAVHTVTSDTGLFESGSLSKGDDFFYTFTEAGEYPYFCAPHGGPGGQGMSGTIVVVP